jgi:hypothetical protein
MKKVISNTKGICPICGQKGRIKMYDTGDGFCEHKRSKSKIVIMGQPVINIDGCFIKKV